MSKAFVIKWVGPFRNLDELRLWENVNNDNYDYHFYMIVGKEKHKRKECTYTGITEREYVSKRFKDKDHILRSDGFKPIEIWIGKYDNKDDNYTRKHIELCEAMIITYWDPTKNIKKTKYYPNDDIVLLNRWYNINNKVRKNKSSKYIAQKLPDLIVYDADLNSEAIFGVEKIKKIRSYEFGE